MRFSPKKREKSLFPVKQMEGLSNPDSIIDLRGSKSKERSFDRLRMTAFQPQFTTQQREFSILLLLNFSFHNPLEGDPHEREKV